MANDAVIKVENVSKRYLINRCGDLTSGNDLRHLVQAAVMAPFGFMRAGKKSEVAKDRTFRVVCSRDKLKEEIHALHDINFEVKRGEILGIIGRNGAGKSTLLKILGRITEPSTGRIGIKGRIASLLEVGTGFHPELTGRENIYLNGAILGMRRQEIRSRFDEMVDFAGFEQFLDTPVKRYSSGMYARLAFAVAAHLEPDIMIVDEVLAVGDAEFQKKCLGKMQDVAGNGRTVLFVSHNMMAMQTLCDRGMVLEKGRIEHQGEVTDCIDFYMGRDGWGKSQHWLRDDDGVGALLYVKCAMFEMKDGESGKVLELTLDLVGRERCQKAFIAVDILDSTGMALMQALPELEPFISESEKAIKLKLAIDLPPLIPGWYSMTLWVGSHNTQTFDSVDNVLRFEIVESPTEGRTFPHVREHGAMVPPSKVEILQGSISC
ncbi:ABC transporter ATP-binding protein [Phragmitibacter flavus]|uniref:ABC transporter ATP-binding protein n=1 Tax=Phragmitibacter flavus TaxID=2576071 RepID=UPI0014077C46|nr:ABC transporter ATP-binding protein [Phragmitibacter flavus]